MSREQGAALAVLADLVLVAVLYWRIARWDAAQDELDRRKAEWPTK